jgi:hypothetical protein
VNVKEQRYNGRHYLYEPGLFITYLCAEFPYIAVFDHSVHMGDFWFFELVVYDYG